MKKCRRCDDVKPLSEYYKHKEMFDGHLNICKECTKKRVGRHREKNLDRIREYDRERGKLQHRIDDTSKRTRKRRKDCPKFYESHRYINNALRDGIIFKPENCSWCNDPHSQIEGHHEDYKKPQEVIWLCSPCHKTLHLGKSEQAEEMRKKIKIPILE